MDKQKEIEEFFYFYGDNKGRKTISRAKGENIIRLLMKEGDLKYYTDSNVQALGEEQRVSALIPFSSGT